MKRMLLLLFILALCVVRVQAQAKRNFATEQYGGMWAGSLNHPACHSNFRAWLRGGPVDLRCLSDKMLASNLLDYRHGLESTYSELPLADLKETATSLINQLHVLSFLESHRTNRADFLRHNGEIIALRYLEKRFNFTVGIVDCEMNCAVSPLSKSR